jgi:hypothetical protein
VVRDFSTQNTFTWDPLQEGTYNVQVAVEDGFGGPSGGSTVVSYAVNSRVTGPSAVITAMSNPLVALYSAPPSPPGTMYVQFAVASDNPSWQNTNTLTTVPGQSTNFLVAGLLPNTTYEMRSVFSDGTTSAPQNFTTGSLPSTLNFPQFTLVQSAGHGSDLSQNTVFQTYLGSGVQALATDLMGNIEWYYAPSQSDLTSVFPTSLVPGGTVLLLGASPSDPSSYYYDDVREVDLAGDVVRETNLNAVNAQLTALGDLTLIGFDHEIQRLPNGDTAVIGSTLKTVVINGNPTQYLGNDVIVLDSNFQVKWVWDAFNYLDVNRGPTLGDVGIGGAVDWLHANAIDYSPADGDLLLSMRSQDWVIKIDYRNGSGNGHVVWRMGQGGDFTIQSSDPSPWFSHQHDARYIADTPTLTIFDDGNTRVAHGGTDSRGQALTLNEQTMQATLVENADLGNYSFALGSAQKLPNGNYVFDSGIQQDSNGNFIGQTIEVLPDGTQAWVLQAPGDVYRSYRVNGLYNGVYAQEPPPAAPSGLSAAAVSSSQINLSWVRNSADETGFKILRCTDGVSFVQVGTAPAGATSYSDTGLAAKTTYYYEVVASNVFGDSASSNIASATTTGLGQAPAAPSDLRAFPGDPPQVNLRWVRNSTDETGFKILRCTDGVSFVQVGTAPAGATTYSDTGLAPNTTYYYEVVAYNAFGDSAPSNVASAITPPAASIPADPSHLSASAVSSAQINLTWVRNSTDETGFKVLRSTDGVHFAQVGTAPAAATTFSDTGLAASTTYYYEVVASNHTGDSAPSNIASATTAAQGQPPSAPSNLGAQAAGPSQINLTWLRNSTGETDFKVLRSTDGTHFTQVGTAPVGATTFSDSGLAANTTYYYEVVAGNTFGDSAPSNIAGATTSQNQPPPVTTGSLSWTASRLFDLGVVVRVLASNGQPLGVQLDLGVWGWLTAPGLFPLFQIGNVTRDAASDVSIRLDFLGLWHVTLSYDPAGHRVGQSMTFF